jgi:hypothetical protein
VLHNALREVKYETVQAAFLPQMKGKRRLNKVSQRKDQTPPFEELGNP